MIAPAAPPMPATELWISFTSLLRSYAAAAGLNTAEPAKIVATADTMIATAGSARLEMQYDATHWAGNWSLRSADQPESQGQFTLLPEGRIELDGTTLDLDHAAIDFAAALMQAAATGNES